MTDQRDRFVLSAIDEPQPFGRDHALLAKFFNDWKLSGVVTIGSGRPVDARVTGDPNIRMETIPATEFLATVATPFSVPTMQRQISASLAVSM